MSKKPENKFIDAVHKKLPGCVYHLKTHPQFTSGEWDVWYEGCKHDLWVEYKHLIPPKRPDTLVDLWVEGSKKNLLSDKQKDWGLRRVKNVNFSAPQNVRPYPYVIIGIKLENHWYGYITDQFTGSVKTGEILKNLEPAAGVADWIKWVVAG